MDKPEPKNQQAGGFLLATAIILGAIVGIVIGEPSMGFLAGTALGAVLAIGMWLRDRRS